MRWILILGTVALTAAAPACGSGTTEEPWDGSGPAEDVPVFFRGRCDGHVCSLSQADTVFEGLTGGWPSLLAGAIVGDTDGDRYDDIVFGDPLSDVNGTDNGILVLFYGRAGFDRRINVSRANASFVRNGWNLRLGSSVAPAGALTGGHAGFLFGAPGWQGPDLPAQGRIYGIPDNTYRTTGRWNLTNSGTAGLFGVPDSATAGSAGQAAGAADMDGDGRRDILVGAPLWRNRDDAGRGAVYVAYDMVDVLMGSSEGYDLANLDRLAVRIQGSTADSGLGRHVAGVGDFDGDGYDDLLMGGRSSYLVYGAAERLGHPTTTADLEAGTAAAVLPWGPEVSAAGDVDGDGLDDFLVAERAGGDVRVHLVYGRTERLGRVTDGAGPAATVRVPGAETVSLAAIGDVDGYRFDDFAIGDPGSDRAAVDAGAVFLFLGRPDRRSGEIPAGDADVILEGPADDDPCTAHAGAFVSGRGDVNWDGRNDILIGASGNGACGKVYLVLGARR